MEREAIKQEVAAQNIVNDAYGLQDHGVASSLAASSYGQMRATPIAPLTVADLVEADNRLARYPGYAISSAGSSGFAYPVVGVGAAGQQEFPFTYASYTSYGSTDHIRNKEDEAKLKKEVEELRNEIAKIKELLNNTAKIQESEHRKIPV
jgi:hypothetical protein